MTSPVTKNFVQVVRAVELLLGIQSAGLQPLTVQAFPNVTLSFGATAQLPPSFSPEVHKVLQAAIPILLKLGVQIPQTDLFNFLPTLKREPLTTVYAFTFVGLFFGNVDIYILGSWILIGNGAMIVQTLQMLLTVHRDMTTISIIRESVKPAVLECLISKIIGLGRVPFRLPLLIYADYPVQGVADDNEKAYMTSICSSFDFVFCNDVTSSCWFPRRSRPDSTGCGAGKQSPVLRRLVTPAYLDHHCY